jgi:hypothetical protein
LSTIQAQIHGRLKWEVPCSASELVRADPFIGGVDGRVFCRSVQYPFWVVGDELIQRILGEDHDHQRRPIAPAGSPRLLSERHGTTWVGRHNNDIKCTDIYSEFEGIRRHDGQNFSRPKAGFDLLASLWAIARAIAPDSAVQVGPSAGAELPTNLPPYPLSCPP